MYISAALPATYPAEAMRAIMGRGLQDNTIMQCRTIHVDHIQALSVHLWSGWIEVSLYELCMPRDQMIWDFSQFVCVFKKKLCVCLSTCLFVLSTLFSSIIIITLLASIAILVSCHAGWGLSHMEVWRGFLVTIGWFLLFLIVAGFALRLRKWVKMVYRTINFEIILFIKCVY